MARSILCLDCAQRTEAAMVRYQEPYRAVAGTALRQMVCDSCCHPIFNDGRAVAITQHPKGPEAVRPWEHEYLKAARNNN